MTAPSIDAVSGLVGTGDSSTLGLSVCNLLKLTFARDPKAEVKVAGSCGVALVTHLEAKERELFEDAKAYAEAAKVQRLRAENAEAKLEAQARELAEARAELDAMRAAKKRVQDLLDESVKQTSRANEQILAGRVRIAALETDAREKDEALRPFAKAADVRLCGGDDHWADKKRIQGTDIAFHITFGDLRRARSALSKGEPQ